MWVMLLFLLIGCVKTKPIVTYQPLQEKTFQSQAQSASISQKSSNTLIQEGFVKIGYLSLNILEKVCRHYFVGGQDISEKCTTFPYSDPTPLLLEQGQQVGGDLVVIEFEKPYTEIMNMMGKRWLLSKKNFLPSRLPYGERMGRPMNLIYLSPLRAFCAPKCRSYKGIK